jgi:cytidine deaminase
MWQRIIETKISVYSFSELSESQQQLVEKAKAQVANAYAPYSGFHVGAAVELANGAIFAGNNQENSAYPSGLCAERVAMFYANAQFPNIAVKRLAISAYTNGEFLKSPVTPCGACRQVLLESETRFDSDIEVLLYGVDEVYVLNNVRQLLPLCFEKSSLKQ